VGSNTALVNKYLGLKVEAAETSEDGINNDEVVLLAHRTMLVPIMVSSTVVTMTMRSMVV